VWNTRTYAIAFNFLLGFGLFMFIVRCIFSWRNWPNHKNCQWTMKMSYGNGETNIIMKTSHKLNKVSRQWTWGQVQMTHAALSQKHDHDEDGMVRWHTSDWHLLTMIKVCGVNTFLLVQETLIQQQKFDIVNNVAADEKINNYVSSSTTFIVGKKSLKIPKG
jgi:hypothetical protein